MRGVYLFAFAAMLPGIAMADQATDLLKKVEQTYQGAHSAHFKAVRASKTQIGRDIGAMADTAIEIAFVKPDKVLVKYDYGEEHAGEWVRASDGKTFAGYREATNQHNEQPASANDLNILNGTFVDRYAHITENAGGAKMLSDEPVQVNAAKIDCHVVEVHYQPGTLPPNTAALPTTYWIDKSRNLVLKETSGTKSTNSKSETLRTLTFQMAEINQPVPADVFQVKASKAQ
jgi:hypothetical protein